ncbi:MAG TPA: Gfo/Idh/MocA family oxidoreductase, partial [bacterium]|nr:Gfo/Idh/MocA family oxidoreductase [bacterium]
DLLRLERAHMLLNNNYGTQDCTAYQDFRHIIERTDIDAVMISTPDHWHTIMALMAARAGKDVCCEKPTLTIREGQILCDTIRRYGRVFQTSTEDRSVYIYHRMAELVRNSRIGQLRTIRVKLPAQPEFPGDPTPMPVPRELDFDMWLGPAPEAPYTKDRVHFNFRWLYEYAGGILTDWGTHLFDTAQWANDTELTGPVEIDGSGANFWEEGLFNTIRQFHIDFRYANGVHLIVEDGGTSIRCEGTDGWIESPSWRAPLQASDPAILDSVIGPEETHLFTCPAGEHRNFLDCVKSRQDPYFSVEKGHRVSSICHLGNISALLDRKLQWDPEQEQFINDAEANRYLTRSRRAPWRL